MKLYNRNIKRSQSFLYNGPWKNKISFTWTNRNISRKYGWIHHSLWSCNQTWKKKTCLNNKSSAVLINMLSEVMFSTIDVLCMVSSDWWTDIDPKLALIFMMIPEKTFAGLINYRFNKIAIRERLKNWVSYLTFQLIKPLQSFPRRTEF